MAFSGAPTRGPLRSSDVSGCLVGRPPITSVRRRGPANDFADSNSNPRSESAPTTKRSRSFAAPICMRAGISSESSSSRRSGMSGVLAFVGALRAREPGAAAGFGQCPHPRNSGRALGHADYPARVEQIEAVACLDALVIGGKRKARLDEGVAFLFRVLEMAGQDGGICLLEIECGELAFRLMKHFAVAE